MTNVPVGFHEGSIVRLFGPCGRIESVIMGEFLLLAASQDHSDSISL